MPEPLTANPLTAKLLMEIPRRFPNARAWRRNVGKAYGVDPVKAVVRPVMAGNLVAAAAACRRLRPIDFGKNEPDICGYVLINGIACYLGIEVKVGKDRLSKGQKEWLKNLNLFGGIGLEARGMEVLDELRAAIDRKSERPVPVMGKPLDCVGGMTGKVSLR